MLQPRGTTEGTEWSRNIDTELELARQFWELILGAPTPGGGRGLLAPTTARSRHGHLPNATLAQYKRFHRTYNLSSDRTRRPLVIFDEQSKHAPFSMAGYFPL